MIYHDRVTVIMEVATGEYDSHGNPIVDHVEQVVPGEVVALDTEAVLSSSRDAVISRYRVVLAPTIDIPPLIGDGLRLSWGPFQVVPDYPTSGLLVDGTVERHMLRGRLHHYELVTKSVA